MTTGGPARKSGRPRAEAGPGPGIAPQATPPGDAETGPPDDVEQLRQEVEQTREQLGATVEQLVAKADVKARARDKAAELTGRLAAAGARVREATPESAQRATAKAAGNAGQYRVPLAAAAAAGALIAGYLLVRQRTKR
jgi:succinyl-CoA synthetase beta subunit